MSAKATTRITGILILAVPPVTKQQQGSAVVTDDYCEMAKKKERGT